MSKLNIVLFEPEIPANTGNIGRTCVATGTRLHLIEPLGFRLNEKSVKRAGMDYWEYLDVTRYINYEDFLAKDRELRSIWQVPRHRDVIQKCGMNQTAILCLERKCGGIPEEILLENQETAVRIPMMEEIRSLNLGNSVAIVLYEALRQNQFSQMQLEGHLTKYDWK